ncbi:MAG TPA: 4-hydroxy-3-methylbut-2-enyl diphosphate reductase [Candidatus Desulfofervidus auxilii]|uniref:4-hydroxy-3-methylbut-2-enyl diphosphate reductase n=1 Tax=Desulfofervidus auxilii TaxID=1621989 RepID=A0A7C0U3P2_DESA2|nr:4-hydroxy-3-methylbut-2-enyl diphosphate reductase [Candidatus Desulfofervidus auxilii]
MTIILAKKAGFCMGVKRAVELVFKTARQFKKQKIFTLGPIIHNPQVLELLEKQGVKIISSPQEAVPGSVVVIRAHGVPPDIKKQLIERNVFVVDATCPRVLMVQQLVKRYSQKGYQVIIVGEKKHPEVKGLCGYVQGQALVINNEEEVKKLPLSFKKIIVVAQTTQNEVLFKKLANLLKRRYPEVKVFNTVCNSTHERQEEVRKIAKNVEAFIVVGGKMSGNTRRLAQIAQEEGVKTYHIETEEELVSSEIKQFKKVAVTAGASTPYWLIRRVIFRLEDLLMADKPSRWIFYNPLKWALMTNFWAALGGASLAIIGAKLLNCTLSKLPFIAFAYLWAMHLLNHLTDLEATKLTDPTRGHFFEKYYILFWIMGLGCIIFSLYLTWPILPAFFILLFLTFAGIIYNIKIPVLKLKLKNLPGSKTILVPFAWGFISAFFPFFLKPSSPPLKAFLVFAYLSILAFIRTCCFDLLDIQGDQMVGRETLPIVLGEKNSFKLLYILVIGAIFLTVILTYINTFPKEAYFYSLVLMGFLLYLWQMEKKYLRPGVISEALIDGQFILMALF